jgi:site-specific DNA-methyltransferase (adenine-specific)
MSADSIVLKTDSSVENHTGIRIRPYYEHAGITIYHGDCRDVLPLLPKVDLVLTDPPYGVGFQYASHDDSLESWRRLMQMVVVWTRAGGASMLITPSCQIQQLEWIYRTIPPDWLICWYKGSPGTAAFVGFNDWEPLLVYGKPKGLQMHDYFYAQPDPFTNGHPCPKPERWATWLIGRASQTLGIILDPFMGSGTTLVAAKQLGRRAIGIEIEERYCEIAAKRLSQEVFDWEIPQTTEGDPDEGDNLFSTLESA